jgi:hypothetical protein
VPSVLVLTDVFLNIAHHSGAKLGLPEPRMAVIAHPLGGLSEEAVRARAATAVDAVVRALGLDEDDVPPPAVNGTDRSLVVDSQRPA